MKMAIGTLLVCINKKTAYAVFFMLQKYGMRAIADHLSCF